VTRTDNLGGILDGVDAIAHEAMRAREDGRHEDALRHVLAAFAGAMAESKVRHVDVFGVMLEWRFLLDVHPPARTALIQARDAQASRVLAGDITYGVPYSEWMPQPSRFRLVVHMNGILQDSGATYALFVQLHALMPERVRREAFLALPAVVEAGDFALGECYLPDPMGFLDELNRGAHEWPLSPFARSSMRTAANLSNFAKEVRLRAAIVRGLGREAEADSLLEAAMAGLATDQMRDWMRQDLASPGAIIHISSAQHMAFEEASAPRTTDH
jgi:hypothetical protein